MTLVYSCVYFSQRPFAFSTGYFFAFNAIFFIIASLTSILHAFANINDAVIISASSCSISSRYFSTSSKDAFESIHINFSIVSLNQAVTEIE